MLTQRIQESLQVWPGPFPDFWVGPGDEARSAGRCTCSCRPCLCGAHSGSPQL